MKANQLSDYERELMDLPVLDDMLLVKRLRRVVRGTRELSGVLRVLETTCPFCWNNDSLDCTCEGQTRSRAET